MSRSSVGAIGRSSNCGWDLCAHCRVLLGHPEGEQRCSLWTFCLPLPSAETTSRRFAQGTVLSKPVAASAQTERLRMSGIRIAGDGTRHNYRSVYASAAGRRRRLVAVLRLGGSGFHRARKSSTLMNPTSRRPASASSSDFAPHTHSFHGSEYESPPPI